MPVARTHSIALVGVEGHPVEIEADIAERPARGCCWSACPIRRCARPGTGSGPPSSTAASSGRSGGSPSACPRPACPSGAAGSTSASPWPSSAPPARSRPAAIDGMAFLGELGLDGQLRPVRGVLPAVAAAAASGFRRVAVPCANEAEAALVPGLRVLSAATLRGCSAGCAAVPRPFRRQQATRATRSGWSRAVAVPGGSGPAPGAAPRTPAGAGPDLADVLGQPTARRAAEICAAGGHHLCLLGPPGAGKTMLAERIPTVLPRLDPAAALEVTAIHSVAGVLPDGSPLLTAPPFCAPHHTATKAAIVGGGSGVIRPGSRVPGSPRLPVPGRGARVRPGRAGRAAPAAGVGRGRDGPVGGDRPLPGPVHPGAGGQPVPVRQGTGRQPGCDCTPRSAAGTWPGCPGRCLTGWT